jgi:hypothetical protein
MAAQSQRGSEPGVEAVARRTIGLARFTQRAQLEMAATQAGNPGVHEKVTDMMAPFIASAGTPGQRELLSLQEQWLFDQPAGSWPAQDILEALWRVEALGVLLWALSLLREIPAYDHFFDVVEVQSRLRDLSTPGELILKATLRPQPEIEAARRLAELWHWRAAIVGIKAEDANLPLGLTFKDLAGFNASAAHERGEIGPPIDGDFPAAGKAYADLGPEELTFMTGVATQRHFALNWLCGFGRTWDETTTET